jgi:hypothetical protein
MIFYVFRCKAAPSAFIVTDESHAEAVSGRLCPDGAALQKVGEYLEMGQRRVAFDEKTAKSAIAARGFYRFEARTFMPVGAVPDVSPG